MHARFAYWFACVCGILCVFCFLLLIHSFTQAIELTIPGLAGDIHIGYADGSLMLGVFEDPPPSRFGWRGRRRVMTYSSLSSGLQFGGDMWGWGVSIPFILLAFFFAVPPAWWAVVYRNRNESQRRIELGLCLHCGYDVRASEGRCPECGNAVKARLGAMRSSPSA